MKCVKMLVIFIFFFKCFCIFQIFSKCISNYFFSQEYIGVGIFNQQDFKRFNLGEICYPESNYLNNNLYITYNLSYILQINNLQNNNSF